MTLYAYDPIEQEHTQEGHPEHRGRLSGTLDLLRKDGILDRLEEVPVRRATQDLLELAHPAAYIQHVREACARGPGSLDADTYVKRDSFEAARAAAGAAVSVVSALSADQPRGFSLMRPPGHHAVAAQAMGFCIFANAVIAARVAQRELGIERVLIVDWDVHHGNGTEAIVYDDPSIAFFSTHQSPFYPGTGAIEDIGIGAGEGFTLNVPLPPGVSDIGYQQVFEELLVPWADRFQPGLIIVSAGYDAHWRDPLAQEGLSLVGFAALQRVVTQLADRHADRRLMLALEGGYDLEVIPHAILNSLRLLDQPALGDSDLSDPFGQGNTRSPNLDRLVDQIALLHGLR